MRKLILFLLILCCAPVIAVASTLVLTSDHHYVVRPEDRSILSTVFTDERLVASVKLDVFAISDLPSSKLHYDELKALTPATWTNALRWSLIAADGTEMPLRAPAVLRSDVRLRGPHAPREADRDRLVDVTTFEGRFDLGGVPAGDYTLHVSVHGLTSAFPVAIRTGSEPEVRDAFLERQAERATSYLSYRAIQMERYHNDPTHIEPVFSVLDRALREAPLDDIEGLFTLVIEKMEERHHNARDAAQVKFFETRVRALRAAEKAVPAFFERRNEWEMVRDFERGSYVIKDRRNGAIVRHFADEKPRN